MQEITTTWNSRAIPVPKPWPVIAFVISMALIAFGLAWELVLDPLRPGGSWLALKVLPLVIALPGLWKAKMPTFRWMSLMVWLYVGEALVRIIGLTEIERQLAWNSLALSLVLTAAILMGARAQIKVAKQQYAALQQPS
ncbi:MAG: hypothetical protein RJA58_1306 [Pseudomonadota bacterium]|jgi:uncharacterized membrane protein